MPRYTYISIWKAVIRWLRPHASWWRFEWPLTVAFAISLPIMAFTKQTQAYNYPSEMWLTVGLCAAAATGLSLLFHFLVPLPVARLAASICASCLLLTQYPDRVKYSSANAILAFAPGKTTLVTLAILLGGSFGMGWAIVRLNRRWPRHAHFAKTVLISFVLVVIAFQAIGLMTFFSRQAHILAYEPPVEPVINLQQPAVARDVYYIVLDRYASQAVLQQDFGYDNAGFYQSLADRGFINKPDAYANYPFTAISLASTLNMTYLTDVTQKLGTESSYSQLPYRKYFADNQVAATFRAAGYANYNVSSWFGVSRTMDQAVNLPQDQFQFALLGQHIDLTDYQQAVLGQTVYSSLLAGGRHLGPYTVGQMLPTRSPADTFNHQVDALLQVATDQSVGPKFVFTHFISPHPPYVFMSDGSTVQYNDEANDYGIPREQKYVNQLQYLNGRILEMVDKIKQASVVPPVIVLAADEGPYPRQFAEIAPEAGGNFSWEQADPAVVRHKTGILQAAFLPDATDETKAQFLTPVNTFRIIFNHYFDAGLPYLPNCSFISNNTSPYRFIDITAAVASTPDAGCQDLARQHQ